MEEIDIIELLKRVKEGKAPKKIEIGSLPYDYNKKEYDIECLYVNRDGNWFEINNLDVDTKIKILDKPIIEELEIRESKENKKIGEVVVYTDEEGEERENFYSFDMFLANKINEIIRHINKENKE